MLIELTRCNGNEEVIRDFRRDICRRIGVNPNGSSIHPLGHSFYLFARHD